MKKFKKVLSLVLALVMVVGFMPMMEKVAKASDSDNFYRCWFGSDGKTLTWEEVGTPEVTGIKNCVTLSGTYADTWSNAVQIGSYKYTKMHRIQGTDKYLITFTAPCDGTVLFYCRPYSRAKSDVNIKVNGEVYGDAMKLEEGQSTFAYLDQEIWEYEVTVVKGQEYVFGASDWINVAQILYIPTSSAGIEKTGSYRWYYDKVDGTRQGVWTTDGSLVVNGLENPVYAKNGNYIGVSSDYVGSTVKIDGNSYSNLYKASNGDSRFEFVAPCDGEVVMYCRPMYNNTTDVTLSLNGVAFDKVMEFDADRSAAAEEAYAGTNKAIGFGYLEETEVWDYTWKVNKGETYTVTSASQVGIVQLSFKPNAVSTKGASYRETTAEHGNGIRFGSTIDKTAIDYDNVTESGTLIALKAKMESAGVTELTMDNVDLVCKKVVRKTYLLNDKLTLNYAAAVVNIPDAQLNTVIVARPYVVIDDVVYYGAQMENSWTGVQEALSN